MSGSADYLFHVLGLIFCQSTLYPLEITRKRGAIDFPTTSCVVGIKDIAVRLQGADSNDLKGLPYLYAALINNFGGYCILMGIPYNVRQLSPITELLHGSSNILGAEFTSGRGNTFTEGRNGLRKVIIPSPFGRYG